MNAAVDISSIILKTDRLMLRPWRETDLEDFYEYASVDGVGQMAGWMPHQDVAESQSILSRFIQGKKTFALEYRGKVIGSLGIEMYNEENFPELAPLQGRMIGYVLSRDHWGQGLMPEAVQAVMKYLFETVGLDFVLVGHFDWNRQSRRVIEKCGFQYVKPEKYETRFHTVENSLNYIQYNPERRENHGDA